MSFESNPENGPHCMGLTEEVAKFFLSRSNLEKRESQTLRAWLSL
jgi:hypothetical protein